MKTILTKSIMAFAIIALITSCSTSNDVASNRGIQKRKYNKGFFVSKNTKGLDTKKTQQKGVKPIELNEEMAEVINSKTDTKENVSEIVNPSTNTELAISDGNIVLDDDSKNKNIFGADNKTKSTETIVNDNLKTNINKKKTLNKQIKQHNKKNNKTTNDGDVDLLVLVILALFIPPLAVFLYEGLTTRFWINLILTILVITWLIASIHAILIVTGTI